MGVCKHELGHKRIRLPRDEAAHLHAVDKLRLLARLDLVVAVSRVGRRGADVHKRHRLGRILEVGMDCHLTPFEHQALESDGLPTGELGGVEGKADADAALGARRLERA